MVALIIDIFVKLNTMLKNVKRHSTAMGVILINLVSNDQRETNTFLHSILNYTAGFVGLRTMAG